MKFKTVYHDVSLTTIFNKAAEQETLRNDQLKSAFLDQKHRRQRGFCSFLALVATVADMKDMLTQNRSKMLILQNKAQ